MKLQTRRRPWARQLATIVSSSAGRFRDSASHIWIGGARAAARWISTSLRFSPACLRPLKNNAIRWPSPVDTMPEVNRPLRCDAFSFATPSTESSAKAFCLARLPISSRILIVVSSLYSTSPADACRISSAWTGWRCSYL